MTTSVRPRNGPVARRHLDHLLARAVAVSNRAALRIRPHRRASGLYRVVVKGAANVRLELQSPDKVPMHPLLVLLLAAAVAHRARPSDRFDQWARAAGYGSPHEADSPAHSVARARRHAQDQDLYLKLAAVTGKRVVNQFARVACRLASTARVRRSFTAREV